MTKKEVIDYYGGCHKTAALNLGIWPHALAKWGKYPPDLRQYQIQVLTRGALKVEYRLRPKGGE